MQCEFLAMRARMSCEKMTVSVTRDASACYRGEAGSAIIRHGIIIAARLLLASHVEAKQKIKTIRMVVLSAK